MSREWTPEKAWQMGYDDAAFGIDCPPDFIMHDNVLRSEYIAGNNAGWNESVERTLEFHFDESDTPS